MSLYEEFTKEKKREKKSLYSSFSEQRAEKERLAQVPIEKARRIEQGLPTSFTKGSAEPRWFEKIAQAPLKLVADVLTNVENAGRAIKGEEPVKVVKNKWLGDIKGLGNVDITKSPWDKENLKVIINSAATGAELGSYLTAGGVAKQTIKDLTKQGVLASKQTFAEWVVKRFPELAKEGLIQGTAYTAGSQGREYAATGKTPSAGQAVKDIGISTIANVAIPGLAQKVFGTSSKKILDARAAQRASEAEVLGRKVFGAEPSIPIKPTEKPSSIYQKYTTTKGIETPASTPLPKQQAQILKDVEKMADEIEGFEPGSFAQWSQDIRKLDKDEVVRVAMGGEKTIPNNIPANAYLSIAKNIAEETGDVKLVKELASSDVASKSGQELVSSRLTTSGNIVDDLRELRLQRLRNKKVETAKILREEGALVEKAQTKLKEFSKLPRQEIDNIINSLICK